MNNTTETRILNWLRAHPGEHTGREIAEGTRLKLTTIMPRLWPMVTTGKVRWTPPAKTQGSRSGSRSTFAAEPSYPRHSSRPVSSESVREEHR